MSRRCGPVLLAASVGTDLPPAKIRSASGAETWAVHGDKYWAGVFHASHYLFLSPSSGSGTLRFAIADGGGEQRLETSALASGSWQHVAVTLSGNAAILADRSRPGA